jgi:Heliorhodopsin
MSLSQYNRGAMMLHFGSAIGFGTYFLAANQTATPQGVELSLRDHSLTFTDANDTLGYSYSSTQTGTVTIQFIQWLLISFFIITAFFHMYYYLADGFISNQYTDMIKNKNNFVRWIEYSISATMMLYIIAFLSGVKDQNIYYLITATNVAMMMQGQWIEESMRNGGEWWVPMLTGFVLLIAEFYVVFRDFYRRNTAEAVPGFTPPGWTGSLVWIMFLFFATFGFISLYNAYTGADYYYIEVAYIFASFIAKNLLGRYVAVFVLAQ